LTEALGIGDDVDLGDLPARDREAEDREQAPAGRRDAANRPVHERSA
jgi:hypothetical protein